MSGAEMVRAAATGGRDALAGLDALDLPRARPRQGRLWGAAWPKLLAVVLALGVWQLVVWTGWKPEYALPGPTRVLPELWQLVTSGVLLEGLARTMVRAAVGYGVALGVGALIGLAVAHFAALRAAVGSLITGLQTMPSIAWFPLAILLFGLSETAILFVVVIGAAPSIANGLLAGIDNTPPLLLRAGRVLGARGLDRYRFVVLPAALPGFVAGLKQGWAFAWRSLMAGELIVIIANRTSLGVQLDNARELSDAPRLIATMLAILFVGIVIDALGFGALERGVLRRRGLLVS
jgi:NitT/TauT family transport system permease protein